MDHPIPRKDDSESTGVFKRVTLTAPPRHGKTDTVLAGIAKFLKDHPGKHIAYIGYNETFAISKVKDLITILDRMGLEPHPNYRGIKDYRLRSGSKIAAVGIDGKLTGIGFHLIIIDDPIKNEEDAMSLNTRDMHYRFLTKTVHDRLEPGGSILIMMTRWHEDDLIARAIKKLNYEQINLPAICKSEDDPLGRDLDEALWPDRYPIKALEEKRNDDPFQFSARYQCDPLPSEERLIKDYNPINYADVPQPVKFKIGADLAYTTKTKSDFSAYVKMGHNSETGTYYIMFADKWKEKIEKTFDKLKKYQKLHNVRIGLENNGVQVGINDSVKKEGIRINRIALNGDKLSRATNFLANWSRGNIFVVMDDENGIKNDWVKWLVDDLKSFTGVNDKHDDAMDATVHAFNQFSHKKKKVRAFNYQDA